MAEPRKAFIDTNVLLRYLVQDDAAQGHAARRLIDRAARGEVILVVAPVVLAELSWVLESHCALGPDDVSDYLGAVLDSPGVETPDADVLRDAVRLSRRSDIERCQGFETRNARACTSSGRAVPWPAMSTSRAK